MKNLIIGVVAVVMLGSFGFSATPQVAEASCGYNGYFHSGGKCGGSYRYDDDRHDEDDDDEDEDEDEDRDDRDDKKYKKKFTSSQSGWYGGNNSADIAYLKAYIERLLVILSLYDHTGNVNNSMSDVDVRTQTATLIDENGATLRATVDMNNEDDADLYFEYGKNARNLSTKTGTQNLDASDDGDTQEVSISGLDDNTRYYFRAVAVDENGDKDYGVTSSFVTTDSNNSSDEDPTVTTMGARNIDSDSAELRGTVDMNDFENGTIFFAYGESENQVSDVEDDFTSYDDVDEDGDDLEKELVDSDLDGTESYSETIAGLSGNTRVFFTLCVAYEDEDGDDTLSCSAVREFTTN